ncbi:MAG: hypothetical protein C0506_02420 [Anaerolinea sp.]|nr:hypothetical protein [Anaerolinea sp.]
MRATIELTDEHRALLKDLAAQRGEKGYSRVLEIIVMWYLETLDAEAQGRTPPPLPALVQPEQAG